MAECAGLENRYTRKGIESSNLSLSACFCNFSELFGSSELSGDCPTNGGILLIPPGLAVDCRLCQAEDCFTRTLRQWPWSSRVSRLLRRVDSVVSAVKKSVPFLYNAGVSSRAGQAIAV